MGRPGHAAAAAQRRWNLVPQENVHVSLRVQECNWLQRGRRDRLGPPAILHGRIDAQGAISEWVAKRDLRRCSNARSRTSE